MSAKNQVILLHKEAEALYFDSPKNPLALIPSNLCIHHTFENNEENPLLKAYQEKLLNKEQSYLCFSFPIKLQNHLLCFFAPHSLLSNAKFAMLDLALPLQIPMQNLCVLFIYPSNALLCFYQNQTLQYCKTLNHKIEDISLLKSYLNTLFEYGSPLYCLSYIHPLPPPFLSLNLIALSSLFGSSSPDFHLCFEKIPILCNETIIPLTSPPSSSFKLLKFMLYSLALSILSTIAFCTLIPSSPPIQDNHSHTLQILSTLQALPSNKPLFLLLQTIGENLGDSPLLEMSLDNQTLKLIFHSQIPKKLSDTLASKGYAYKSLDFKTLEISL